ncbi:MAG: tetratricopeptide repeat protein [Vicinamibacterales bacterium]
MHSGFTRTAVIVVGIAASTTACGKYSLSSILSLKAFKDGVASFSKGDYRGAVPEFEESVRRNPDFGLAYFYLGNSYDSQYKPAKKGDPQNDGLVPKAVENYRIAIDKLKDSTEPRAAEFRKLSYEYLIAAYGSDKLNEFDKAEPAAKELIAIEPGEPSNYQALGKLYEDQGRMEDAEAMFQKAVEVKPADPQPYQQLAGFYNRQGKFEKTMEAFQQRANMEPNNPEAWHLMGSYYYDKVTRDKALAKPLAIKYLDAGVQAEDKAIALNTDYFEALTFKNLLLRLQANFEPAGSAKQKQLLDQANQFFQRALAAQAKQAGQAAAQAGATKKD